MIGKIIKDFAPTKGSNPRNSEGSFIELRDGRILFAYSRFKGAGVGEDHDPSDIYGCISNDMGETFGDIFPIFKCDEFGADNIMSVSLFRFGNGDIALFFLMKKGADCLGYISRSADEGETFSKPILCTKDKGHIVINNDRIITLKSGRIILPAAYHEAEYETDKNGKTVVARFTPGTLCFFASDDDGYTWYTLAEGITVPYSRGFTTGVNEPGVIELNDGRLWCYIRTNSGRQYECFSSDDGKTWTETCASIFTSACSPLSSRRLTDGRIALVWNPVANFNGSPYEVIEGAWIAGRSPLVISTSDNEVESFKKPVPIETDKRSGYCYVAIFETKDNSILLAYCAGSVEDGANLNRLRIRKIRIDELDSVDMSTIKWG